MREGERRKRIGKRCLREVYMPIAHRLERKMLFETPQGAFFVTFTTSGTDRRTWRLSSLEILMTSAR